MERTEGVEEVGREEMEESAIHCALSGGGGPVMELFWVFSAAAAISGAWR